MDSKVGRIVEIHDIYAYLCYRNNKGGEGTFWCNIGDTKFEIDDIVSFNVGKIDIPASGPATHEEVYVLPTDYNVEFPNDDQSIRNCFLRCYRYTKTRESATEFYNKCSDYATEKNLTKAEWLNRYSEKPSKIHKNAVKYGNLRKMLRWWLYHRIKRKLILMGINYTIKADGHIYSLHDDIATYSSYTKCIEKLQTDPLGIFYLPLSLALKISAKMGLEYTSEEIDKARTLRIIYNHTYIQRNSCMPIKELHKCVSSSKFIDNEYLEHRGIKYVEDKKAYYIRDHYTAEHGLGEHISNILSIKFPQELPPIELTDQKLTDEQIKAINIALSHRISIITGGAGRGKTMIVSQLRHNYKKRGHHYCLCAPTGKAVSRLKEKTGETEYSMTLHLLIEKPKEFREFITHLVIDEASMLTTKLFYDVLCKCPSIANITLIGDINQLQPVQWGNVLLQLMQIDNIPLIKLNKNHRQHDVFSFDSSGKLMENEAIKFVSGNLDVVYKRYNNMLSSGINPNEIIIITPYNKHVDEINIVCQKSIDNSSTRATLIEPKTKRRFSVGDKVIMTKNDNDKDQYNGDIGRISSIRGKKLYVDFVGHNGVCFDLFNGTNVNAGKFEENKLTTAHLSLAYALTVHRSQGSEWLHVIFYIPQSGFSQLVNFNLIYTAITRFQAELIIIGDISGFHRLFKMKPCPRLEYLNDYIRI